MLVNKLEQLALQLDSVADNPERRITVLQQVPTINSTVDDVLRTVEARHAQFSDRLLARQQLQAAIGADIDMPAAAKEMLATDQLAFYAELLGDMLYFFTGSERGRCVAFNLTVEELLFFVRLLLEEKVMDVETLKAVFLFLSRHARTSGSETLSYESLRKKYSNVGQNAKERVAALVERLARRAAQ